MNIIFAFIISTNVFGYVTLKAETGMALCGKDESGPSTITEVCLSKTDSPDNWKDCKYGDPIIKRDE